MLVISVGIQIHIINDERELSQKDVDRSHANKSSGFREGPLLRHLSSCPFLSSPRRDTFKTGIGGVHSLGARGRACR